MIDTAEQTTCKACGKPLEQAERRGPRHREYCNATCRQRAHRAKSQQPIGNVTTVTMNERQALEQRIAQLERENAKLQALRGTRVSSEAKKLRLRYIERCMTWGEKLGYQPLTVELYTGEGIEAWGAFMREANEKLLIRLIIAAKRADEKSKQS